MFLARADRLNPPFLTSVLFLFFFLTALSCAPVQGRAETVATPPKSTTMPQYEELRAIALKDPTVCWLLLSVTRTDIAYQGSSIKEIVKYYWKEGKKEKADAVIRLFSTSGLLIGIHFTLPKNTSKRTSPKRHYFT